MNGNETDTTTTFASAGLFEVQLSDKHTVKIKELNGWEQRLADATVDTAVALIGSTRAVFAIREINGTPCAMPQSELELRALLSQFTGREVDKLSIAYGKHFGDEATDANAKN